jgi:cell wall-associated NlpC family hydrolase
VVTVAITGIVETVYGGQPSAVSPTAVIRPVPAVQQPDAPRSPASDRTAGHAAAAPNQHAWARAAVTTVWIRPGKARPIDRPVLVASPNVRRWLDQQTLAQREDLTRRVMTQAVRGEPVEVLRQREGWSKVRLPLQRGSYFDRGIIGWVRSGQLAHGADRPAPASAAGDRAPTGANVLRIARGYLGVRYLWGGMSRHGIDCSGLTYRVLRELGRTLPRDAADQAREGHRVLRRNLRPGDLVFFGPTDWTSIHHVGIYAGDGLVLHAPHTGARVRLTPLSAWSDYWGARRIVG